MPMPMLTSGVVQQFFLYFHTGELKRWVASKAYKLENYSYTGAAGKSKTINNDKCPKISYIEVSDQMVYVNSADKHKTALKEYRCPDYTICQSIKYTVEPCYLELAYF